MKLIRLQFHGVLFHFYSTLQNVFHSCIHSFFWGGGWIYHTFITSSQWKKALNSYFCFFLFLGLSTFLLSFLFLLNENSFFLWQTNFYAVFKAKLSPCLGLLMFFKLGFELYFFSMNRTMLIFFSRNYCVLTSVRYCSRKWE